MKKICLLFLLFSCSALFGQLQFETGISTGVTHYFGDLGNEEFFQSTSTQPGISIAFRNFIDLEKNPLEIKKPISFEGKFSWFRVAYDETKPIGDLKGMELRNYGRGLSFRTDVIGVSAHLTYTFYLDQVRPSYQQNSALFAFAGIGAFHINPKADLFRGAIANENRYHFWNDGTVRDQPESSGSGNVIQRDGKYETNLRDWRTEGQGGGPLESATSVQNQIEMGIPVGFGFKFGMQKKTSFAVEFTYFYLFTDYLDDVSNRYATNDEIVNNFPNDPEKQALAAYISDPTGKGTNGYPGPATSPRGNPKRSDSFSFVSFEIAHKFELSPIRLSKMLRWL